MKTREFKTTDGNERITVEYDNDGTEGQSVITRSEKNPKNGRFRVVESVCIPDELLSKVVLALGGTEWQR